MKLHLTLLHSERPKLYTILAFLSAIGLNIELNCQLINKAENKISCLQSKCKRSMQFYYVIQHLRSHMRCAPTVTVNISALSETKLSGRVYVSSVRPCQCM